MPCDKIDRCAVPAKALFSVPEQADRLHSICHWPWHIQLLQYAEQGASQKHTLKFTGSVNLSKAHLQAHKRNRFTAFATHQPT